MSVNKPFPLVPPPSTHIGLLVPLSLVGTMILIAVGGTPVSHVLRYDRNAVMSGEIWRLVTGSFVHGNWSHLLWNVGGLILCWVFFFRWLSPLQWMITTALAALGVGFGLLLFSPGIYWYVGFSGVLHGWFVAGAIAEGKRHPRNRTILLGLVASKLAWEMLQGSLPGTEAAIGGKVLVDPHLYGAISGIVAGWFTSRASRRDQ